jgi:hypothetical protein
VFEDHLFRVAEGFCGVSYGDVGLLEEDSCEGMSEAVWGWWLFPWAAGFPESLESFTPVSCDNVAGVVVSEDARPVFLRSYLYARLVLFGEPDAYFPS